MLAKRLKELRISKNMSQAILGEKFGVTQSAIGMWETGIRNPDIEMLNKISKYFNVSIDSLISEKYNENLEKTKGNLKEKLNLLDAKINAEDKVIYQVMDLINIKYNGIEKMAIDEETLKIIKEGHKKAIDVLSKNRDLLTKVAERLLEKETIMGDEFMSLVKGEEASITGDNVENNENNESDDNLNNDTKLLE